MKTTIGIPVYDDFPGIQWTIQDLLIHHDLPGIEIIVVDNHPNHDDKGRPSRQTINLIQYIRGIAGKYIPLKEPVGTAPARNKIFEIATGDIIIVCDSHVIFGPKAIDTIKSYLTNNPLDIVTGPLLKRSLRPDRERLKVHATHYSDIWRREMWGIWAQAWQCPCKQYHFEVRPKTNIEKPEIEIINGNITASQYYPKPPKCLYYGIKLGDTQITKCPKCNKEIPNTDYHTHENHLIDKGYIPRGWSDIDIEPFEIPGLGLGMFACCKNAWPGFPKEMQGFGGGELHLHELFRRNGGKAICLPNAKWWHYFEDRRITPAPYNPNIWDKVRNYTIWRKHLDMPLDPVYNHFVIETKRLSEEQWKYLIEDPINRINKPNNLPDPQPIQHKVTGVSCDQLYQSALTLDKNFEFYFPIIEQLSSISDKIISVTNKNHWDIAILKGKPGYFISHSKIVNEIQEKLLNSGQMNYEFNNSQAVPTECDILLVEVNSKELLDKILQEWPEYIKKWIIILGTGMLNPKLSNDLYLSIIDFTNKNDWKRVYNSKFGIGLTIMSNNPLEKSIDMGVGYNLTKLYLSLGIRPKEDCKCKKRNKIMNELGPDGCLERFDELVADMKTDADKYKWNDKLIGGTKAILNGLAFQINPFKPIESLLTIAINRTRMEK